MSLEELLKTEREMFKQLGTPTWVLQEFVLRHGRSCAAQPLPKRFRMRQPKNCYWNAQAVVDRNPGRYWYCEGYVQREELPIPVLHGWAVDSFDWVIDPTLSNFDTGRSESHKAQYFGIVFNHPDYRKIRPRGGGPLLVDDYGCRVKDWVKLDPGFQAVIDLALTLRDPTIL